MEPKNIEDMLRILKKKIPSKESFEWMVMPEEKATASVHHTLGRFLRNKFGLWTGDTLIAKYMKRLGLKHADDMSGLILICFHRHLNNKPLEIKKEVNKCKEYWCKDILPK